MKQILASTIDIIIIVCISIVATIIEAILLPINKYESIVIPTIIIIPLVYNYSFDIVFNGMSLGNRIFNIKYSIGELRRYKLFHAPLKTIAMYCWPITLWMLLSERSLPYYDVLDMNYVIQEGCEAQQELNCELFIKRILSTIVDFFIIIAVGGIFASIILNTIFASYSNKISEWYLLLFLILIYQIVFDYCAQGKTLGKRLFRLKIYYIGNNKLLVLHGCLKIVASVLFVISIPYSLIYGEFPYDKLIKIRVVKTKHEISV